MIDPDSNTDINPTQWTVKELVKHLYREMEKVNKKLDEISDDVTDIKDELSQIKAWQKTAETIAKLVVGLGAALLAFIEIIIPLIRG